MKYLLLILALSLPACDLVSHEADCGDFFAVHADSTWESPMTVPPPECRPKAVPADSLLWRPRNG